MDGLFKRTYYFIWFLGEYTGQIQIKNGGFINNIWCLNKMIYKVTLDYIRFCYSQSNKLILPLPYLLRIWKAHNKFLVIFWIIPLTLFRMGYFGTAHGWGGKKAPHPKICHIYSTMTKLDTVIPKEDSKHINI